MRKVVFSAIALIGFTVASFGANSVENINQEFQKSTAPCFSVGFTSSGEESNNLNDIFIVEVEESTVVKTCTYVFKDAEGNILNTIYIPNVPDDQSCQDRALIARAIRAYQITINP